MMRNDSAFLPAATDVSLEVRDLLNLDFTTRVLFVLISQLVALVLKLKFNVFAASSHFAALFIVCSLLFFICSAVWIFAIVVFLRFQHLRFGALLSTIGTHVAIEFLAPFVCSLVAFLMLLYSLALVFQRDETLKTAFQSKTGSRIIWTISAVFSVWSHPLNEYNRLVLYFHTDRPLYPMVSVNPVDAFILAATTFLICFKLFSVCKHPKLLSNLEVSSITHISVLLLVEQMFLAYKVVLIVPSDNWKNFKMQMSVSDRNGLEVLFATFAPFLYPYSVLFSLLFSMNTSKVKAMRSVRFDGTRTRSN